MIGWSRLRGVKLINLLIGGILGVFITMIGFPIIQMSDINITLQTMTSITIAFTAVVAMLINYFAIQNQKEARFWDVNKDILIKVSKTLSELMTQTSKLTDNAFAHIQDIPEEHTFTPDDSIHKKFETYLDRTVDVYGLILNDEIITAVNKYKKTSSNISYAYSIRECNDFEFYDALYTAQTELLKVLNMVIKKYANI